MGELADRALAFATAAHESIDHRGAAAYLHDVVEDTPGQHHHVSKQYLYQYANEMAWREDHARVANGTQHKLVLASALHSPVSRAWKGYWQRTA